MSEFEYLRNISIGQYLPLDTPIHRMDPRAKLAGFTLILLAVTLTSQISGLFAALAAAFLLAALSRVPFSYILRGLAASLPFLLILAAIQVFITPHAVESTAVVSFLGISIFPEGLLAAGLLLLRFAALLALMTISTSTASTLDVIHGLDMLLIDAGNGRQEQVRRTATSAPAAHQGRQPHENRYQGQGPEESAGPNTAYQAAYHAECSSTAPAGARSRARSGPTT